MPDPRPDHVGFTGTRKGITPAQDSIIEELLAPFSWLDHGDCTGGDKEVHLLGRQLGMMIEVHPSINERLRAWCKGDHIHAPKGYASRNNAIVVSTSYLIAAPADEREILRSGTWMTVRIARKLGRPTAIVYPSGRVEYG